MYSVKICLIDEKVGVFVNFKANTSTFMVISTEVMHQIALSFEFCKVVVHDKRVGSYKSVQGDKKF